MTRSRFTWLVTLALFAATTSQAWSRGPKAAKTAAKSEMTCTVYALKDLGNDPKFVEWVAQTIPNVIKPGTWSQEQTGHTVAYYPERHVLVIYHTAAVQTEVAAFIDSLKKAMPKEKESGCAAWGTMPQQQIMPASYTPAPAMLKTPNVMTIQKNVYPIPPPLQQPKHLFHMILQGDMLGDSGMTDLVKDLSAKYLDTPAPKEESKDESKDTTKSETPKTAQANPSFTFIIRYEGEGIVDNNVADLLKAIYAPKKDAESSSTSGPAPGVIVQSGYTTEMPTGTPVLLPPAATAPPIQMVPTPSMPVPPAPVMPSADGEAKPKRTKRAPQSPAPAPEAPQAPGFTR